MPDPQTSPSGTINIGAVPFDSSYAHVLFCADKATHWTTISPYLDKVLYNYKYVRANESIYVEGNCEDYVSCNYCSYVNSNYSNRRYYAFIREARYVSEHTTQLVIETDVFATYLYDTVMGKCYTEREIVYNDAIGHNTVQEPALPMQYAESMLGQWYSKLHGMVFLVETTADTYQTVGDFYVAFDMPGGVYRGIYSGCCIYAFTTYAEVQDFLSHLNKAGAADAVTNVFMYPLDLMPTYASGYPLTAGSTEYTRSATIAKSSANAAFQGYTPRNNKLYCYPYNYIRLTDNAGQSVDWQIENFSGDNIAYTEEASLNPNAMMCVWPTTYAGLAKDFDHSISFPITVRCSWQNSAYDTWSAQHFLPYALRMAGDVAGLFMPAAKGAGTVAKMLGGAVAYGAASDMLSIGQDVYNASLTPNNVRGSADGNLSYIISSQGYKINRVHLKSEYAILVDNFFTRFGYEVDRVKYPNLYAHSAYDYVKTAGPCLQSGTGNAAGIPLDALERMNQQLMSGCTLWHAMPIMSYGTNTALSTIIRGEA